MIGRLLAMDSDLSISVVVTFKNTGLSRIVLEPPPCRIHVDWLASGRWAVGEASWTPAGDQPVPVGLLQDHEAVEPGEAITDQALIILAPDAEHGFPVAFLVRADVVGRRRRVARRYTQWSSRAVVPSEALVDVDNKPIEGGD